MTTNRSLGKAIGHIARGIRWIVDHELEATGTTSATLHLVRVVHRSPGITQNELSDRTGIDKATAARGVAKLESLGYLRRSPDSLDHRKRRLNLTDAGEQLVPGIHAVLRHVTDVCATDLSAAERDQLFMFLDRVERAVSAYVAECKENPRRYEQD